VGVKDADYSPAYQDEYQRLWHKSQQRLAVAENILRKATAPRRPDGTYNYSREAFEQMANDYFDVAPRSAGGGSDSRFDSPVAPDIPSVIPATIRDAMVAMAAEMHEPSTKPCDCGYPEKPCLRIMLRNGPPFPARPCESA